MCCSTLATDVHIHDFGLCFPPNGFMIASLIAPLTTTWYFPIFNSIPKIRFKSEGATTTSSSVPRTGHQFWKSVLHDTHSWWTKVTTQTQFVQSIMVFMRFLRYSSCTRWGICPPVKTSLVQIHIHVANLDPTQLSSSSHLRILSIRVVA